MEDASAMAHKLAHPTTTVGAGDVLLKDASTGISINAAFKGTTVLLTGVTGYIGGLVLEQLLRMCPEVSKVYVLVRGKGKAGGEERLRAVFEGPIFSPHHSNRAKLEALLAKCRVISGDTSADNCGLSEVDRTLLCKEVNFVIHAAASISFTNHIQDAIKANYLPAQTLAKLARDMPALRAFIYISTAFVNSNQPRGTRVEEKIYPLTDKGKPIHHAEIVERLMKLTPDAAEAECNRLQKQWKYLNTYFVSKTMTERMISEFHRNPFPVAIVRPAIVSAVARAPLPGYVGNTSGATGAALAIATGIGTFIQHRSNSIIPLVPGDMVSSIVLAAAAATYQLPPEPQAKVYHADGSFCCPVTIGEFSQNIREYFRLDPPTKAKFGDGKYKFSFVKSNLMFWLYCKRADVKFGLIARFLIMRGHPRLAVKVKNGWKAWRANAARQMDWELIYDGPNVRALDAALAPGEKADALLLWDANSPAAKQAYIFTYMAGLKHRYLHEEPGPGAPATAYRVPAPLPKHLSAAQNKLTKLVSFGPMEHHPLGVDSSDAPQATLASLKSFRGGHLEDAEVASLVMFDEAGAPLSEQPAGKGAMERFRTMSKRFGPSGAQMSKLSSGLMVADSGPTRFKSGHMRSHGLAAAVSLVGVDSKRFHFSQAGAKAAGAV